MTRAMTPAHMRDTAVWIRPTKYSHPCKFTYDAALGTPKFGRKMLSACGMWHVFYAQSLVVPEAEHSTLCEKCSAGITVAPPMADKKKRRMPRLFEPVRELPLC